jgi:Zn finger protein HypA/HybF involved in hydrogenase expression
VHVTDSCQPSPPRPRIVRTKTCAQCGKEYEGTPGQRLCKRCSSENVRAQRKAYAQKFDANPDSGMRKYLKRAHRTCLQCEKPFASEGPWNRRCPRCKETDTLKNNRPLCPHRTMLDRSQWDDDDW